MSLTTGPLASLVFSPPTFPRAAVSTLALAFKQWGVPRNEAALGAGCLVSTRQRQLARRT
eukprot:2106171-Pleurochrysis_carterae.AAC.2